MNGTSTEQADLRGANVVRLAIYLHLMAVVISEIFSLADRGLFWSHEVSRLVYDNIGILMVPSLFAFLFGPPIILFLAIRKLGRSRKLIFAIMAEACVAFGHVYALMPACQ